MTSEPMSPAQHKAEAERLLALAVQHEGAERELRLIAAAQVHATLASIGSGSPNARVPWAGGPYG